MERQDQRIHMTVEELTQKSSTQVMENNDDRLLSEEQAAAATLSSLIPYVASSTGSSTQPSWVSQVDCFCGEN